MENKIKLAALAFALVLAATLVATDASEDVAAADSGTGDLTLTEGMDIQGAHIFNDGSTLTIMGDFSIEDHQGELFVFQTGSQVSLIGTTLDITEPMTLSLDGSVSVSMMDLENITVDINGTMTIETAGEPITIKDVSFDGGISNSGAIEVQGTIGSIGFGSESNGISVSDVSVGFSYSLVTGSDGAPSAILDMDLSIGGFQLSQGGETIVDASNVSASFESDSNAVMLSASVGEFRLSVDGGSMSVQGVSVSGQFTVDADSAMVDISDFSGIIDGDFRVAVDRFAFENTDYNGTTTALEVTGAEVSGGIYANIQSGYADVRSDGKVSVKVGSASFNTSDGNSISVSGVDVSVGFDMTLPVQTTQPYALYAGTQESVSIDASGSVGSFVYSTPEGKIDLSSITVSMNVVDSQTNRISVSAGMSQWDNFFELDSSWQLENMNLTFGSDANPSFTAERGIKTLSDGTKEYYTGVHMDENGDFVGTESEPFELGDGGSDNTLLYIAIIVIVIIIIVVIAVVMSRRKKNA